jgi:nucleotide sugar dehydrogenase
MKIYAADMEDVTWKVKRREITISMMGLGTVGLPMATLFALNGFKVIGFDVDNDRVRAVNSGTVRFEYQQELLAAVRQGRLTATNTPDQSIRQSDVLIVSVPTPLNGDRNADLSYVRKATEIAAHSLEKGHLVVYESTVPVGTVRRMAHELEAVSNLTCAVDFGVASCPERYDPSLIRETHPKVAYDAEPTSGNLTLDRIPRVVGGIDSKSAAIAAEVYSAVVPAGTHQVSSLEVAEASKILENVFRNVNIALVNELARSLSVMGLDAFEVIDAARTKPFAFMAHYPGPGVGGECIPVVPWFLIKASEGAGLSPTLTRMASEVNEGMGEYLVTLVQDALKDAAKETAGSRICILGLAYKKNIGDTRLSPAYKVIDLLKELNCEVHACDPLVEKGSEKIRQIPLEDAFKEMDGIVLVTDHDVFRSLDLETVKSQMRGRPIIVDGRDFFDPQSSKRKGFIYRGIGKPL